MPEEEIRKVFSEYPDILYGFTDLSYCSYKESYRSALVFAVPYGEQQEHPEQHLADRVADYWGTSKRRITTELLSNVAQSVVGGGNVIIGNILPSNKVTVNGSTFAPAAIGRDWREDVVRISLMEI